VNIADDAELSARWRELVETRLPETARGWPVWPVALDHCFARILLDTACGRPWREVVTPPAWRNMPADRLGQAIATGEAVLAGTADLAALNRQSLALRGKARLAPHEPRRGDRRRGVGRGAGQRGRARRRNVVLWMRDREAAGRMAATRENARYLPGVKLHPQVTPTARLGDLGQAGSAWLATPAQTVRDAAQAIAPALAQGTPMVICAKGIERETGRFLSEVVAEGRPGSPIAVLSGPSFALDVARGLPTAVALAAPDGDLAARLAADLSVRRFGSITARICAGSRSRARRKTCSPSPAESWPDGALAKAPRRP
jgi:hypothetical protein